MLEAHGLYLASEICWVGREMKLSNGAVVTEKDVVLYQADSSLQMGQVKLLIQIGDDLGVLLAKMTVREKLPELMVGKCVESQHICFVEAKQLEAPVVYKEVILASSYVSHLHTFGQRAVKRFAN